MQNMKILIAAGVIAAAAFAADRAGLFASGNTSAVQGGMTTGIAGSVSPNGGKAGNVAGSASPNGGKTSSGVAGSVQPNGG